MNTIKGAGWFSRRKNPPQQEPFADVRTVFLSFDDIIGLKTSPNFEKKTKNPPPDITNLGTSGHRCCASTFGKKSNRITAT